MSVVSGIVGANASSDAADTQAAASQYAANLSNQQFQTTNEQLAPWRDAGTTAINRLNTGTQPGGEFDSFTYNDMTADPGYAFRMQQGVDALQASGAAAGNYGSGNLGTALTTYGQNMGSNEYASAYSRWQDQYNRLAQVAGVGQNATNTTGTLGANNAATTGSNYVASANAQAMGQVNSTNSFLNGIAGTENQIISGLGTYAKYQQQQSLLDQYKAAQNSSYWGGGAGDDMAIENIINAYEY